MKTTIKYSTRALVFALITILLLSGIALAAMKTLSLGPFVSYDLDVNGHYDPNDIEEPSKILDDTAAPKSAEGVLRESEWSQYMDFATYEDAKPHLNTALNPALPTALPDGYALNRVSLMADDDGKLYPAIKYLTVYYNNQDRIIEMAVQLMDEETAYEVTGVGALTEMTINGHSALIEEGRSQSTLSLLIDDVLYSFRSDDPSLTMDDLIKMAESIQG